MYLVITEKKLLHHYFDEIFIVVSWYLEEDLFSKTCYLVVTNWHYVISCMFISKNLNFFASACLSAHFLEQN